MNARRYFRPQETVAFVVALFAFVAINAGAPLAAGIGVAAAAVIVIASVLRVRVIG